jgi:hypothetical protein
MKLLDACKIVTTHPGVGLQGNVVFTFLGGVRLVHTGDIWRDGSTTHYDLFKRNVIIRRIQRLYPDHTWVDIEQVLMSEDW